MLCFALYSNQAMGGNKLNEPRVGITEIILRALSVLEAWTLNIIYMLVPLHLPLM